MSGELAPPSRIIDAETADRLRAQAVEAERGKKLTAPQLAIVAGQRWLKLFVPAASGGLGLTLPQALVLEEALAWVDGSLAWVVTLCGGAGWFAGFIEPALRDELFATPACCLAGSGASAGTAEVVEGGYRVKGAWPYASGAEHATAFTANCVLTRGGEPWLDAAGARQVAAFIFLPGEVTLHRTWNSVGLAATGSHGFSVDGVTVPANRRFQIDASQAHLRDVVYRYPFLQLAEATLAVNLSGMAWRFLELAGGYQTGPELAAVQGRLDEARRGLNRAARDSWASLQTEGRIAAAELMAVSVASKQLAITAREAVDAIYPLCGLAAADVSTEINRVWRDLHTASQHALLRPA